MEEKVKLCYEILEDGDGIVSIVGMKSGLLAAMSALAYCMHTRTNIPESEILSAVAEGLCGRTKKLIDGAVGITELNLSRPVRKDEGK